MVLTAEAEALVNTVNTVGIMGKGIALQFKRAYPDNFTAYSAACKRGEVRLGRMFVYELGQLEGPRFIINFPTKGHWKSRSRLSGIRARLQDLKRVLQELGIASVAAPPLGCGNGGLKWDEVKPTIEAALGDLHDVDISLYVPADSPAAVAMPVRTHRPDMTRTHAALLLAFERYVRRSVEAGLAFEEKLSLLEAHKIAYLLQLSGWPFGLSFAQGHFGPYADSLDRLISSAEGHFLRGYGDGTSGSRAALTLDETALAEAHVLLDGDPEFWAVLERFEQTVVGYEFPYGIELLATVHFAGIELVNGSVDADKVIDVIQGWSSRKGRIFKPVQARLAFNRLVDRGLLPA